VHTRVPQLRGRAGSNFDLVAVGKIDRMIENHLVAVFDARAHLDGGSEVAHHGDGADARDPVLDHGNVRSLITAPLDAARKQT
jgi:hypothetical protein